MDKKAQIGRIIQYLKIVQEQPKFHFDMWNDTSQALSFIRGFNLACHVLGISSEYEELYTVVQKEWGLELTAQHPINQLQELGCSLQDAIHQALELEIKTWEKVLKIYTTSTAEPKE